jgi:hypothetical protein
MLEVMRFWFTKDLVSSLKLLQFHQQDLRLAEIRQGQALQTVQLGSGGVLQGAYMFLHAIAAC